MAVYGFCACRPRDWSATFKAALAAGLAGAALSTAAYAIAIWAMTVAPIALVAALRETSVLFGALFATLLLREPWIVARVAAAGWCLPAPCCCACADRRSASFLRLASAAGGAEGPIDPVEIGLVPAGTAPALAPGWPAPG